MSGKMDFSHLDEQRKPRMVDVTAKEPSFREAVALGTVRMKPETVRAIEEGGIAKGDVLAVARIAGVMGAKRTPDLIPLCHPLEITGIDIAFRSSPERGEIEIEGRVRTVGRTGVEMEAMTAVGIAALTIYDMCKSADREIVLTDIRLMEKRGGKSGTFVRNAQGQSR
jgi:cyclic pyranopterin phosphate synthase